MTVQTGPLQLRRLTTAQLGSVTPAVGEPVYDKTLKKLVIGDGVTLGGVVPSNTFTADKLTTARDIALTGSVTGTVSFDGSGNVSMATSVGATLQASLDLKAPLASPGLTGTPTAPTAATGTNTTQVATTAFVRQEIDAQLAWTTFTLQNSWTAIAGRRAVYRKILGQVQIEFGVAGGTATDGTVLATLPVGFRPSTQIGLPVVAAPNVAPGAGVTNPRVTINIDGTITCQNVSSANGVSFSVLMPLN